MVFENLSVFQNILFLMACIGIILLAAYLICLASGIRQSKKNLGVDDIDSPLENLEEPAKFVFNAFALKGSIYFWAIASSIAFLVSVFTYEWLGVVIGVVVAALVVIILAYLSRETPNFAGELAIVSEEIGQDSAGKVILLTDGSELSATTASGKTIKKNKKVVVVEHTNLGVIVKKYKRHNK
jgi:hypothetical protein